MSEFDELPVIPAKSLMREARVSETYGKKILEQLRDAGEIHPVITPTKRENMTPLDGRRFYEELLAG